jgi:hypothetical protein
MNPRLSISLYKKCHPEIRFVKYPEEEIAISGMGKDY